jgi:hypothetical protein
MFKANLTVWLLPAASRLARRMVLSAHLDPHLAQRERTCHRAHYKLNLQR